mmetsp:Transcript_2370/g.6548  ORF Transcript_2370/g.6548 Transcript_2370/m.6548 type:complete len:220 (-) Transcript_2370:164-823(-)
MFEVRCVLVEQTLDVRIGGTLHSCIRRDGCQHVLRGLVVFVVLQCQRKGMRRHLLTVDFLIRRILHGAFAFIIGRETETDTILDLRQDGLRMCWSLNVIVVHVREQGIDLVVCPQCVLWQLELIEQHGGHVRKGRPVVWVEIDGELVPLDGELRLLGVLVHHAQIEGRLRGYVLCRREHVVIYDVLDLCEIGRDGLLVVHGRVLVHALGGECRAQIAVQ